MAQILNNIIAWMVPYCSQQLLEVNKKTKTLIYISLDKAGPFNTSIILLLFDGFEPSQAEKPVLR